MVANFSPNKLHLSTLSGSFARLMEGGLLKICRIFWEQRHVCVTFDRSLRNWPTMQCRLLLVGGLSLTDFPSCLADMHGVFEVMQTIILRSLVFYQQALVNCSLWSIFSQESCADFSKLESQRELGLAFSLDKSVLVSGRSTAEPQRSEGYTALSRHGNFQKHGCLSIGWMQTKPWASGWTGVALHGGASLVVGHASGFSATPVVFRNTSLATSALYT